MSKYETYGRNVEVGKEEEERKARSSGCNLLKNAMFINQHEVQVIVSKFLNFQVAQREVHSLVVVVVLEGAQVAVVRPSDDHASME